jgi:hypothetical protein
LFFAKDNFNPWHHALPSTTNVKVTGKKNNMRSVITHSQYTGEFNLEPKKEEEIEHLKKLHEEELHNFYFSLYACFMMIK